MKVYCDEGVAICTGLKPAAPSARRAVKRRQRNVQARPLSRESFPSGSRRCFPTAGTIGTFYNGTTLSHHKQKFRHTGESRHPESGLSAEIFQILDSGFRRNDGINKGFFLKVVPLGTFYFSPCLRRCGIAGCGNVDT